MGQFEIDPKVFEVLPTYCVGLVVAKGIDNTKENSLISERMEEQMTAFAKNSEGINLKEYDPIKYYRDAFYAMNMNPNKFMCSIEALAKRVQKGNKLPHINPIVDVGNVFSLKYILPMGAHDINKLEENLTIRFSEEGDTFLPLGEEKVEQMPAGELIYVSGRTVKTRRWIWRQSDDGKITEESADVVFPIDGFTDKNLDAVLKARDELAALLKEQFGCAVSVGIVDKDQPSFAFDN